MSPHLPKEVVAAIELAVNIAHSQNKKADLKSIAAIFNTSYESVRFINKRVKTTLVTGVDPRKRPGPRRWKGANVDEIDQCIREAVGANPEIEQRAIKKLVEEKFGLETNPSSISRFIKAKNIPWIGGQGGPKNHGGRGEKKGPPPPTQPVSLEGTAPGTFSESTGAENKTLYSSPYGQQLAPPPIDETAIDLLRIYGGSGQSHVAFGPYS